VSPENRLKKRHIKARASEKKKPHGTDRGGLSKRTLASKRRKTVTSEEKAKGEGKTKENPSFITEGGENKMGTQNPIAKGGRSQSWEEHLPGTTRARARGGEGQEYVFKRIKEAVKKRRKEEILLGGNRFGGEGVHTPGGETRMPGGNEYSNSKVERKKRVGDVSFMEKINKKTLLLQFHRT